MAFKMKYKKGGFPFKESPMKKKNNDGWPSDYTPRSHMDIMRTRGDEGILSTYKDHIEGTGSRRIEGKGSWPNEKIRIFNTEKSKSGEEMAIQPNPGILRSPGRDLKTNQKHKKRTSNKLKKAAKHMESLSNKLKNKK